MKRCSSSFKPRTNPYAFQGLGLQALRLVEEARKAFDLGLVSEATEVETFDEVERVADLVQIGARNTLDVSVIPAAKALTHMPITADPSHAA